MPLSENEQRILRQIERQFQQERWLARSLRMPVDQRQATRNAKRAAGVFVLGLIALSLSFAISWMLGLVGFIIMLAAAVVLVQSLRRLAESHLPWARGRSELDSTPGPRGLGERWRAGRGEQGDRVRPDDEGFGPD